MRQFSPLFVVLCGASALLSPAFGQSKPPPPKPGPITITWHKRADYQSDLLRLFGAVTLTGSRLDPVTNTLVQSYQLEAETVDVHLAAKSGPAAIKEARAESDPETGKQVKGRFASPEEARTYELYADHARYVPEPSRPGGGRMDFTGHVKVLIYAPEALAQPSETDTDSATIYLGQNAPGAHTYPRLETSAGHITLVPLQ